MYREYLVSTTCYAYAKSQGTSDSGSQYRCGWVGRGIQPPSTPQPPPLHTKTYTNSNTPDKIRRTEAQLHPFEQDEVI